MVEREPDEDERRDAIETERQRVAAEQATEAEATRKREANVAHKKRINGEVLDAMMQAMGDAHSGAAAEAEKIGKAIITAIAKGEIRHVSIAY